MCITMTENRELIKTLFKKSSNNHQTQFLIFYLYRLHQIRVMQEQSLVDLPCHPMSYTLHVSLCGQEEMGAINVIGHTGLI